jgi:hypothetical protein
VKPSVDFDEMTKVEQSPIESLSPEVPIDLRHKLAGETETWTRCYKTIWGICRYVCTLQPSNLFNSTLMFIITGAIVAQRKRSDEKKYPEIAQYT